RRTPSPGTRRTARRTADPGGGAPGSAASPACSRTRGQIVRGGGRLADRVVHGGLVEDHRGGVLVPAVLPDLAGVRHFGQLGGPRRLVGERLVLGVLLEVRRVGRRQVGADRH